MLNRNNIPDPTPTPNPSSPSSLKDNVSDELQVDKEYLEQLREDTLLIKEILNNDKIEDLTHIPEFFVGDPVLNLWVCPITQKPIRIPLILTGTQMTEEPLYYESFSVMNWIEEHQKPFSIWNWLKGVKENKPPKWPEKISLGADRVVPAKAIQKKIDERLKVLCKNFKEEFDGLEVTLEA